MTLIQDKEGIMNNRRLLGIVILMIIAILLLAACRSSPGTASAGEADHHEEEEAHTHSPADHMAGAHGVPEEAAEVPNPIPANDESIAAGAAQFASTCAVCHGESGHGDGPGAAGLEKQPADLTASHVQELSD
jgi:mono/diheme cytochrome c family protein